MAAAAPPPLGADRQRGGGGRRRRRRPLLPSSVLLLLLVLVAAAITTSLPHAAKAARPAVPDPEHPLGVDHHGRRRTLLSTTLRRCGTHAPERAARLLLERTHAAPAAPAPQQKKAAATPTVATPKPNAVRAAREAAYAPNDQPRTIEVPTYVTVVLRDGDGPTLVSDATVNAQLAVLNKAYGGNVPAGSPVRWSFVLKGPITRVQAGGSSNAGMCDKAVEARVKKERRQGGPEALNLYFADLSDCGLLGYSTWPWDLAANSTSDGVVIHSATMPGGSYKPYDLGFTSVHEIGHWFGLYHTFQNGCTGAGDSVDDTPYVAIPTQGCPRAPRDTCPQPGNDPQTNPMDYADDACMEGFTLGQQVRMDSLYRMYRSGGGGTSA